MKGTNNDVTNSKLLYALENQNTTTVHAYESVIIIISWKTELRMLIFFYALVIQRDIILITHLE